MTAPTMERVRARKPAPAEQEAPNPVSEAARVMALHRWHKPYGDCAGQLAIALVLEGGGGFTPDPEDVDG